MPFNMNGSGIALAIHEITDFAANLNRFPICIIILFYNYLELPGDLEDQGYRGNQPNPVHQASQTFLQPSTIIMPSLSLIPIFISIS